MSFYTSHELYLKLAVEGFKYPVLCDHSKEHLVVFAILASYYSGIRTERGINFIMLRFLALAISVGKLLLLAIKFYFIIFLVI